MLDEYDDEHKEVIVRAGERQADVLFVNNGGNVYKSISLVGDDADYLATYIAKCLNRQLGDYKEII